MQLVWNDDGIESERKFPKDEGEAAGEMLTLCLLGFHTGLRMGDCCMLRWDSVDLGARRITAVPMKTSRSTGKTVIIPICQELHDRLAAVRPPAGEGCVCPTKARQYQENRSEVSKRFRTLFVQCGLRIEGDEPRHGARAVPAVGFHSFRHTWVTQSAEAGVDSITIREIVGWGSPAMERIYTHLSPEHVERQFGRRSSLTVMGGAASVGSPAGKSVAAMPDDQLAQLATLAAEELARRQSGK
jgi:integrase